MWSSSQFQPRRRRAPLAALLLALATFGAALFNTSLFDDDEIFSSVDIDRRQLSGYTIHHPGSSDMQIRRLSGEIERLSESEEGIWIDAQTALVEDVEDQLTATDADADGDADVDTVADAKDTDNDADAEGDTEAENVVLLTVSGGFFDMWTNWLRFFERLRIPDLPILLFPEDEQAHQKCLEQVEDIAARTEGYKPDLTCLPWDFAFSDVAIESDVGALSYGTDGYKKMMARRPVIVLRELELGHNVIFSDVDVVWKKNPLPYIQAEFDKSKAHGEEAHILGEMGWKGHYRPDVLCPGFMVFRASPETTAFVDMWRSRLEGKVQANQWVFNDTLEKSQKGEYDFRVVGKTFPQKLFANGYFYFQDRQVNVRDRQSVVVVHNNFIIGYHQKVARMKKYGLWVV